VILGIWFSLGCIGPLGRMGHFGCLCHFRHIGHFGPMGHFGSFVLFWRLVFGHWLRDFGFGHRLRVRLKRIWDW
jgi:hypothetical protein